MQNIYLNYPTDAILQHIAGVKDVKLFDVRLYSGKEVQVYSAPESIHVSQVSYSWYHGTCLEEYDSAPFYQGNNYVLADSDYEKFIKITAVDNFGNTCSKSFFVSRYPVLYINTKDKAPVESKDSVKANLVVQGNSEYECQYDGEIDIHVRGNSSAQYDAQKPYKVKLDVKTDLFGLGANKHWVLLSHFIDSTLTRNKFAFDSAKQIGLLGMDSLPVTVILNGRCDGVYLLCEHLRISPERIDIFDWEDEAERRGYSSDDLSWLDDTTDNVDGGWVLELDSELDEVSMFDTDNGMHVKVNRPEYAVTSNRMFQSIKDYMNLVESCYNTKDGDLLSEFVDLESAARYVMLNMCLDNEDFGQRSRYCYKDINGKLKFSPVWDFDIAMCSIMAEHNPCDWSSFSRYTINENDFQRKFLQYDWFKEMVIQKYKSEGRALMQSMADRADAYQQANLEEGQMNDTARRVQKHCVEWRRKTYDLRTFQEDCREFKRWLQLRVIWLDSVMADVNSFEESIRQYALNFNQTSVVAVRRDQKIYDFSKTIAQSKYVSDATLVGAYGPNATSIGSSAFYCCYSLTTASFPNATSIGDRTFQYCRSLTAVSFPNATSIGDRTFYSCASLATASFPNVTSIGYGAFYCCYSLTTASFPNVTSIGVDAFVWCSSLATASFPNVTSIGVDAFCNCYSLTSASFPNVTSIGSQTFYNCRSLTTASFPNVTSIGSYAFYNCSSLTSVSFPNVTSIGDRAFYSCASLTTASLPNVSSINPCFGGCTRLKSVYVENDVLHSIDNGYGEERQIVTNISNQTVYCAVGGISQVFNSTVTSIGSSAFYNCYSLTTASFPNVTSIGDYAFQYCSSLASVSFPNVTSIGDYAFQYCYSLTIASFPNATSIGAQAFYICSSLASVSFPNVTSIGSQTFYNCRSLTTASFPNVTSIGVDAFVWCSSLATASFPNVTSIGSYAFMHCSSLTTASFPNVTSIGSSAFYNCISLTSIYLLGSSVPTLANSGAFSNVHSECKIYVPSQLISQYQVASNWSYLTSRFAPVDVLFQMSIPRESFAMASSMAAENLNAFSPKNESNVQDAGSHSLALVHSKMFGASPEDQVILHFENASQAGIASATAYDGSQVITVDWGD